MFYRLVDDILHLENCVIPFGLERGEMINGLYAKCYRGVELATGSRGSHCEPHGGALAQHPVGASVQKEESGILLTRDAKWLTGVFNERIDRPVIRYLFGQEPRAWFVLMPPLEDTAAQDLAALQGLVPMGFKVMLKEVYKRFRWAVPQSGEKCLGELEKLPIGDRRLPIGEENEHARGENGNLKNKGKGEDDDEDEDENDGAASPQKKSAIGNRQSAIPIAPGADPARNPG